MKRWSRRDLLKTSLAAPAARPSPVPGFAALAEAGQAQLHPAIERTSERENCRDVAPSHYR